MKECGFHSSSICFPTSKSIKRQNHHILFLEIFNLVQTGLNKTVSLIQRDKESVIIIKSVVLAHETIQIINVYFREKII